MALSRNVGSTDKMIRLIAGVALVAWGLFSIGWSSVAGIVMMVIGAVLITTGIINFCPLFKILGISSLRSGN